MLLVFPHLVSSDWFSFRAKLMPVLWLATDLAVTDGSIFTTEVLREEF